MSIPLYEACMLPLLEALSDGQELHLRDATKVVADKFGLTEEERQQLIPSGQARVIASRVGWAKTYLKKAGLVQQPKRGIVKLTDEGQKVLQEQHSSIDAQFLKRYPLFVEFLNKHKQSSPKKKPSAETAASYVETAASYVETAQTPEEMLEESYEVLRDALADDILEQIMACSPSYFETLVVDLLVAMGYGGSVEDAGKAVGKSGDAGIDGVIKEDKLGLDVVVIQAKRWDTSKQVSRQDVQAFAGSMEGYRAKKGVFIATCGFSGPAKEYVGQIERKIVLIDGKRLADLMIEHDLGVTTYRSYILKRVDTDYFEEQ